VFALDTSAATFANVQVWPAWNDAFTANTIALSSSTLTSAVINPVVWLNWNQRYSITSTASTTVAFTDQVVWQSWIVRSFSQPAQWPPPREPEHLAQARLLADEARKKADARASAARVKARKLLWDHLTDEQRQEATAHKRFHLTTRSGRIFRIKMGEGKHGNIKELVDGREVASYCVAPVGHELPEEDALLAQKLALDHDELGFLKVANMTRLVA